MTARQFMRILMLTSNWPPATGGGAEAYVARLTAELRGAGHTVAAVTLGIPGDDVVAAVPPRPHELFVHRQRPRVDQVRFHAHDLWRSDSRDVVQRAISRFRPDVLHSHVVTGMSVAALQAPARSRVAHVHTLHDHWLRCRRSTGTSRSMGPCGPSCMALARVRAGALHRDGPDLFVAISDALASAHDLIGPLEVVRHPADIVPRARTRTPGPVPVFGFLGMLNPNKGIDVYLRAADRLRGEARFLAAGRGQLEDQVRSAPVEYRGWVQGQERERFFEDIDCLVVPSTWPEPAGLVVREAAARGLPVIATDVGGLPEYVPSSCRALLFPPRDADALVDRMNRFVDEPVAFVVDPSEIPTWDDHLARIVSLYARVCAAPGTVPR